MSPVHINYVAVVVATVVHMALGALWYSKALFGKQWMKAMGRKESDMDKMTKDGGRVYVGVAVAALVTAYVLAYIVQYSGASTLVQGAQVGFWVWLGFIVTKGLVDTLFEGKDWNVYYISMGYNLVSLLVMGAILAS